MYSEQKILRMLFNNNVKYISSVKNIMSYTDKNIIIKMKNTHVAHRLHERCTKNEIETVFEHLDMFFIYYKCNLIKIINDAIEKQNNSDIRTETQFALFFKVDQYKNHSVFVFSVQYDKETNTVFILSRTYIDNYTSVTTPIDVFISVDQKHIDKRTWFDYSGFRPVLHPVYKMLTGENCPDFLKFMQIKY
ncbi:hypothetical protein MM5_223 [Morganella phage vB_Mm5]